MTPTRIPDRSRRRAVGRASDAGVV
jgi:hypothetical protein